MLFISSLVLGLSLGLASASPTGGQNRGCSAIYVLTNKAENGVAAALIGRDGKIIAGGKTTATGGAGANGIDGSNKQPAKPDALFSQSALTIAKGHIFAVNAGSNTVSMLRISRNDPTQLTLVGTPAKIPGEFPVTVAASGRNNLVCVATTGAKAGVSCAPFSASGIGAMDELRAFDLGQTTPPVGPTNTVSHSFFSADESTLFTTVKGDPPTNKTGFLSAFNVQAGGAGGGPQGCGAGRQLSRQETRSSPEGTAVLFGSAPIPGSTNLFVTDAAFGAAVLAIQGGTGQAALAAKQAIEGQKATCWATVSPATKTAFVTDVASNRVVEMRLDTAAIVGITDLTAQTPDPGLIDLRAAGNFVYALSPGNGTTPAAISVLDVSRGPGTAKLAQHFDFGAQLDANSMGVAILA